MFSLVKLAEVVWLKVFKSGITIWLHCQKKNNTTYILKSANFQEITEILFSQALHEAPRHDAIKLNEYDLSQQTSAEITKANSFFCLNQQKIRILFEVIHPDQPNFCTKRAAFVTKEPSYTYLQTDCLYYPCKEQRQMLGNIQTKLNLCEYECTRFVIDSKWWHKVWIKLDVTMQWHFKFFVMYNSFLLIHISFFLRYWEEPQQGNDATCIVFGINRFVHAYLIICVGCNGKLDPMWNFLHLIRMAFASDILYG